MMSFDVLTPAKVSKNVSNFNPSHNESIMVWIKVLWLAPL